MLVTPTLIAVKHDWMKVKTVYLLNNRYSSPIQKSGDNFETYFYIFKLILYGHSKHAKLNGVLVD